MSLYRQLRKQAQKPSTEAASDGRAGFCLLYAPAVLYLLFQHLPIQKPKQKQKLTAKLSARTAVTAGESADYRQQQKGQRKWNYQDFMLTI